MMIKTETTVTFRYPEERDAEIAFSHDNDMSEWIQSISSQTISYKRTKYVKVELEKKSKTAIDVHNELIGHDSFIY